MRMGELVFKISYVVDIDDESMIDRAAVQIIQDIADVMDGKLSMNRYAEVITDNGYLEKRDIPAFLKDIASYGDNLGDL